MHEGSSESFLKVYLRDLRILCGDGEGMVSGSREEKGHEAAYISIMKRTPSPASLLSVFAFFSLPSTPPSLCVSS